MVKVLSGRQTVPLEEVVLAQAFQLEALLNVLEKKGVINKAEVLEEIKRLQALETPRVPTWFPTLVTAFPEDRLRPRFRAARCHRRGVQSVHVLKRLGGTGMPPTPWPFRGTSPRSSRTDAMGETAGFAVSWNSTFAYCAKTLISASPSTILMSTSTPSGIVSPRSLAASSRPAIKAVRSLS